MHILTNHNEYLDKSFFASSIEIKGRALLDPGKAAEAFQYLHNKETHHEVKDKLVEFLKIFSGIQDPQNYLNIMTTLIHASRS